MLSGRSIIVIDDEVELVSIFKSFLEKEGYDVLSFTDPLLALEYFKETSYRHALIITDMRMPHMCGIILAKKIREINDEIKIFLMTAFETKDLEDNADFKAARFDRLLQKQKWLLNACPVIGPSIEFDSSGRMHVFYFTGNGTEGTGYYYVTSDDLGKTFSSPQSILTSEFIPASAIQTDLSIDGKGNVWLTFGTVPDVIEPGENPTKTINVVVMDKQGKTIGKTSFDSRQSISSTPSLASHGSNTFLSYPDVSV